MNKLPLLISSLVVGGIVGVALVSTVNAQIASRPIRVPAISAGDWHGFKNNQGLYRYDSRTGATQQMGWESKQGGNKIVWVAVTEDKNDLPAGGSYEVIEGDVKNAMALRIERSTGKAWIMYGVNGGTSYWQSAGQ
jgi:hypothetical protein